MQYVKDKTVKIWFVLSEYNLVNPLMINLSNKPFRVLMEGYISCGKLVWFMEIKICFLFDIREAQHIHMLEELLYMVQTRV